MLRTVARGSVLECAAIGGNEAVRGLFVVHGGEAMYLLWEIIIGILAGFIASKLVSGSGMGILLDLVVGIVGAILGGWIFGLLGLAAYGLIGQLVMAVVGAVVLLLIVKAIKRT
jgi:uncharacterized membrane protein YeaQ/YmgE (transglycosylase-associated protein family)